MSAYQPFGAESFATPEARLWLSHLLQFFQIATGKLRVKDVSQARAQSYLARDAREIAWMIGVGDDTWSEVIRYCEERDWDIPLTLRTTPQLAAEQQALRGSQPPNQSAEP